jgi:hypothetical protein
MKSLIAAVSVIALVFWGLSSESEWDVLSVNATTSPFNDGTVCEAATHRNGVVQTICFDEVTTWYGTGVKPVYVIENGVTRLF